MVLLACGESGDDESMLMFILVQILLDPYQFWKTGIEKLEEWWYYRLCDGCEYLVVGIGQVVRRLLLVLWY